LGIAEGDELTNAGEANGDEREFDRGEEAVQGNKRKNANNPHEKHALRYSPQAAL
jgi:hypothetical protein